MTVAPMRRPPSSVASIRSSGSSRTSTSRAGRSTPVFIRSTRLVPPPRKRGLGIGAEQGDRAGDVDRALVSEFPHAVTSVAVRAGAVRGRRGTEACGLAPPPARPPRRSTRTRRSGTGCRSSAPGSRRRSAAVAPLRAVRRRWRRSASPPRAPRSPRWPNRSGRVCSSRTGSRRGRGTPAARDAVARRRATPSMVVISRPSAATASWRQDDGPAAVEQHRAGAALTLVAALLGAGQIETLAQRVEQGGAVVDGQRVLLAVDVQGDGAGRR